MISVQKYRRLRRIWTVALCVFGVSSLISICTDCQAQKGAQGDPGAAVTGNRRDVLTSSGDRLIETESWPQDVLKFPPTSTGSTSPQPERIEAVLADQAGQNRIAINTSWTLNAGYLVMFMMVGFALLEIGLCRKRSAAHVGLTNLLIYPIGALGFWAVGFSLMFSGMASPPTSLGGINPLLPDVGAKAGPLIGNTRGFFLNAEFYDVGVFAMFLFQVVFMDTMATIPTGAMAERWRISAFVFYGLFVSMLLYPIYGHWVWGCGWLSYLGMSKGWGHGAVDFAGSGVVHAVGGWAGLAGAIVLGPRLGRFSKRPRQARTFRPHNIPFVIVGTLVLAFGWFGFNSGSTLSASGGGALRIAVIATNTMIASASGACAAFIVWWVFNRTIPFIKFLKEALEKRREGKLVPETPRPRRTKKGRAAADDPLLYATGATANGMLGGLVAITASCGYVDSHGAFWIGWWAGVLVCLATWLLFVCRIDDPVGAFPVHGVCGIWGVVSVGLWADGNYGKQVGAFFYGKDPEVSQKPLIDHLNNTGVTGWFYGDHTQIRAQLASGIVCILWSFLLSLAFFMLQQVLWSLFQRKHSMLLGYKRRPLTWRKFGIRTPYRDDARKRGVDSSETGMPGYSD